MPHSDDVEVWSGTTWQSASPEALWVLCHETDGIVSLSLGRHPHGYELRLVVNRRFVRSRVHATVSEMLVDAADTRRRFEMLGFEEVAPRTLH
jgi:hypothetical protein